MQTFMEFKELGEFRLGYFGSIFDKPCFFFDFILHTAYNVDACALASILSSLSLIDVLQGGQKSDAGVGSGRRRQLLD